MLHFNTQSNFFNFFLAFTFKYWTSETPDKTAGIVTFLMDSVKAQEIKNQALISDDNVYISAFPVHTPAYTTHTCTQNTVSTDFRCKSNTMHFYKSGHS